VNTLDIVLLAIAAVLLVVVLVGTRISRRRQDAGDARLLARLSTANEALAQAHAGDNGWDKATMEAAARAAHSGPIDALHLVQVIDRPGTEADEAVFHAVSGARTTEIRLGRVGEEWVAR